MAQGLYTIVGTAHEVRTGIAKNGSPFASFNVMTILGGAPTVRRALAFGSALKNLVITEGGDVSMWANLDGGIVKVRGVYSPKVAAAA